MAVQIRLSAPTAELDAAVEAVRRAFAVTSVSGRRRNTKGDPGERLHIVATGPAAAGATQPSPLAVAEDAKRSRDLLGELSVLQAADRDLKTQPWYPLQPGDVVLCTLPPLQPDQEPYGETRRPRRRGRRRRLPDAAHGLHHRPRRRRRGPGRRRRG